MTEFKAKYVHDKRFYDLRKLNFWIQFPPGLAIGIVVGGMIGETNWGLIIFGGIIYVISTYFSYIKMREFKKLYEALPKLKLNEDEFLMEVVGKKEKRMLLLSGQRLHLQVRATSLRERLKDYFKKDYAERSANFLKINDTRYDFIIESEFALRKLLTLIPIWKKKGIRLSWDFEKAFEMELKKAGIKVISNGKGGIHSPG